MDILLVWPLQVWLNSSVLKENNLFSANCLYSTEIVLNRVDGSTVHLSFSFELSVFLFHFFISFPSFYSRDGGHFFRVVDFWNYFSLEATREKLYETRYAKVGKPRKALTMITPKPETGDKNKSRIMCYL